jgi:pimeloyl-ACP methyl ester carboxylesterase
LKLAISHWRFQEEDVTVKRGYIDTETGQIHYRYAGERKNPVITLFHPSPGSSRQLHYLIAELAKTHFVYAPDTPGNGLSDPLPLTQPEIADYAASHLQALKALRVDSSILFGTHTGASIAAHLSQLPDNPATLLILDSVGLYDRAEQQDLLAVYAPPKTATASGEHLSWAWHFVKNQWLFWPWYKDDKENRLHRGLPEIGYLHGMCVDVLESLETYHLSYNAAFRFDKEACFKGIECPTIIASDKEDMLFKYFPRLSALIPNSAELIHTGWQNSAAAKSSVTLLQEKIGELEKSGLDA